MKTRSEAGRFDFKTTLLILAIIAALMAPLVYVGYRVRAWFNTMYRMSEGSDYYVVIRDTELRQRRGDNTPVPQGAVVRVSRGDEGQMFERDDPERGKCVWVRYSAAERGSDRGYIPWNDLKKTESPRGERGRGRRGPGRGPGGRVRRARPASE